ncbi:MAG: hypothetical protein WKF37_03235 [Bryobacteraceae bacterium]
MPLEVYQYLTGLRLRNRNEEEKAAAGEKGSFIASGLIAGEALMGIVLAVTFLSGIPSFTRLFTGVDQVAFYPGFGGWLSLAGFLALGYVLIWVPTAPLRQTRKSGT